ncbi:hypothetical protein FALBO_7521 [Fusarium albosuccineum]|uniref:Uncharacterized protein n=1 Tax=Fusarium albosuccineum TaxID=1237068 RepID=A0A8H4LCI3_9HYPO|nr:hypothetical protein FALBO_7521 [Fusarium albosuccineum]
MLSRPRIPAGRQLVDRDPTPQGQAWGSRQASAKRSTAAPSPVLAGLGRQVEEDPIEIEGSMAPVAGGEAPGAAHRSNGCGSTSCRAWQRPIQNCGDGTCITRLRRPRLAVPLPLAVSVAVLWSIIIINTPPHPLNDRQSVALKR